ncbi:hypothetical protein GCM10023196_013810 [Actinoallomurus vinaceus]|uniref:Uncharacterized protein n=1 Tax=Actinoallomurus vinaceus TaxID=1080074 RepID=A0ABP8U2W4_9ACTN
MGSAGSGRRSRLDAEALPRLASLNRRWSAPADEDTCVYGLRALVAGLLPGRGGQSADGGEEGPR